MMGWDGMGWDGLEMGGVGSGDGMEMGWRWLVGKREGRETRLEVLEKKGLGTRGKVAELL